MIPRLWFVGASQRRRRRRSSLPILEGLEVRALLSSVHAGYVKTFTVSGNPGAIVSGPDGNLWFVEQGSPDRIGRITPAGALTEFPLPTTDAVNGIVAAPDGNLWFLQPTGRTSGEVGRITPGGSISEFPLPAGFTPTAITAGPDGDVWVAENGLTTQYQIVQVAPAGTLNVFPVATILTTSINHIIVNEPIDTLAVGPGGNLWFGGDASGYIGEMTPGGVVTYDLIGAVAPYGPLSQVLSIVPGSNDDLWFLATEQDSTLTAAPGHIAADGTISAYTDLFSAGPGPGIQMTMGPDGNLWSTVATEYTPGQLQQITPAGSSASLITQLHVNIRKDVPLVTRGITSGPGGTLWITEYPFIADPKSRTTYTIVEVNVSAADSFIMREQAAASRAKSHKHRAKVERPLDRLRPPGSASVVCK